MRQFSRRLFGANAREVREFLAEAAVELDRARVALARAHAERDALQNRLREVATEVDRLRGQVAVAHEKIAAHQAQEGLAIQIADERESLVAEREVLRSTLRQIASEVESLRGQLAEAEEKIAVYQAREGLGAQLMAERDALAALRDSLQNKLNEATTELHRLREQAAASRDKIAAYQARKALAAQMAAERDALRRKLKDITTEIQALRDQVATAQATIAAYQAEDREIAETLLSAQKAADDLVRAARQQAEDVVTSASAEAAAEAEQAIQAARKVAAETLRAAVTRAEETVRAAEQVAEARLAHLQVEAEWMAEEARRAAAEAQPAGVPSEAAAHHEGDPLEKAQDPIIPTLYQLVDALSGSAAREATPPAPPASPATAAPATPPSETESRQKPGGPGQDRVIRLGVRGEIIVSPVRTRYRATKIAEGVSRMKGIRVARLRSLQQDAASIEVLTEAGTLVGIDFTMIDGVPMDVIEATDARLVLRVARTLSQSIPG